MSYYTNFRRWLAAHRDAVANYDELAETEAALNDRGLLSLELSLADNVGGLLDLAAADSVALRNKLMSTVGQLLGAHVAGTIVTEQLLLANGRLDILGDGLSSIIAEVDEAKSPNGSVRKLGRLAREAVADAAAYTLVTEEEFAAGDEVEQEDVPGGQTSEETIVSALKAKPADVTPQPVGSATVETRSDNVTDVVTPLIFATAIETNTSNETASNFAEAETAFSSGGGDFGGAGASANYESPSPDTSSSFGVSSD